MSRRWRTVSGAMGGLLVMGVVLAYAHSTAPAVEPKPVTYSTDKPSEAPVARVSYVWHGTANDPKYIRLPSIRAEGFIEVMGIDQHNQIAAPGNVNVAGWYVHSARPGEAGLSIIDGHVDGLKGPGIFKHLDELAPNDQFTIERGDGSMLAYRVVRVETIDAQAAAGALFSQEAGIARQLNLITCGGTFDRAAKAYVARTIVVATPAIGGTSLP